MKGSDVLIGQEFDVDSIGDGLGKPVEQHIKPLVVAFNTKGYPTSASCEGHPLSEWKERLAEKVDRGDARLVSETERGLTYLEKSPISGRWYHETHNETPWVDLKHLTGCQILNLASMIDAYNKKNPVNWTVEPFNAADPIYRIITVPCYSLEEMQADIPRFAEHVLRS